MASKNLPFKQPKLTRSYPKQIATTLPEDVYDKVLEFARTYDITLSKAVCMLVEKGLKNG
jgi:hypothetical protein